ncbi:MAG TPA: hypothetical protein VLZ07_08125 [Syntrophales bacterium]|nr:hypothetical protein [Syntrophales bacterium]
MKRRLFLIALVVLCLAESTASGEHAGFIEKYTYEARPITGEAEERESAVMEIRHGNDGIEYHSLLSSSKSSEDIRINMDGRGRFISGTRKTVAFDGELKHEGMIWREGKKIFLEENESGKKRTESYELADGRMFAVDGSLLFLLRFFPFGTGEAWKIFMVDFAGYSITVDARLGGIEMITVPSGTFDCYRMEVVVEIPLLHPRLTYWLAKETPHYLVKGIGKRGPLSDTYVTVLVSKE